MTGLEKRTWHSENKGEEGVGASKGKVQQQGAPSVHERAHKSMCDFPADATRTGEEDKEKGQGQGRKRVQRVEIALARRSRTHFIGLTLRLRLRLSAAPALPTTITTTTTTTTSATTRPRATVSTRMHKRSRRLRAEPRGHKHHAPRGTQLRAPPTPNTARHVTLVLHREPYSAGAGDFDRQRTHGMGFVLGCALHFGTQVRRLHLASTPTPPPHPHDKHEEGAGTHSRHPTQTH